MKFDTVLSNQKPVKKSLVHVRQKQALFTQTYINVRQYLLKYSLVDRVSDKS